MGKNFWQKIISLVFFMGAIGFPLNLWARMESTNYIIWADVVSSGGDEQSSSANYILADSIGEALILSATSTSVIYGSKAGFREMYPDQYLSFSLSSNEINFSQLSRSEVRSGSHTMTVDTNATKGYIVTVSGNTLGSVSHTIDAIGSIASVSNVGTEQFGINLVANTDPAIGANLTGTAPVGSVASSYDTTNKFAYASGNTIAQATNDINPTTYTISYIANVRVNTEAGSYTTTLIYSLLPRF